MPRLHHSDLRKLMEYIGECYVLRSQQALAEHLVTSLGQLVPGDIIAYNEICTERGKVLARWAPSNVQMIPNGFEILAKHAIKNSVVPYFEETGNGNPKKVTDFIPLSKFQRCSLHNEFNLPFRIRYHMSTSLRCSRKSIVTLTSHRWGKDYSESERMLLGLLRPHLI